MTLSAEVKGKIERWEHLPPSLELNDELLRELGIGPTLVEGVLNAIRKNGDAFTTLGSLMIFENKEELIEFVGGDVINGKIIWRSLHPPSKSGEQTVRSKRPLPVVDDSAQGIRKFMRTCVLNPLPLKAVLKLDKKALLKDRMVPLAMELNDRPGSTKWILFRECFSDYFTSYIRPALHKNQNVFIGGAQGIGKSVFTDILALLLVQEGEIVLLEHCDYRLLLIGENPNMDAIKVVKKVLQSSLEYDPESVSSEGSAVYVIREDFLFNDLATASELIVIQDLGSTQGKTVSHDGRTKKIWISSPNAEKLKPVRGDTVLQLCVPPVTIEEMLQIRKHWNPNEYSENQVRERYSTYGGSVRLVLQYTENFAKEVVEAAISEARNDTLSSAFASTLLNLPKGSMSGLLVHPLPEPGDPRRLRRRFASNEIGRRLLNKFVSVEQRGVATFLSFAREHPEMRTFAGYVLEDNVHGKILSGITVKAKPLKQRMNPEEPRQIKLPKLVLKAVFSEQDFTDIKLEDLVENAYFRPVAPNFPTIDSFVILPLSIFIPGANGMCLVTIQSTISKSHITEGYILERLFKHVEKKWPNIPRYHVFLTGPNGIRTKQKVDMEKAEGGPYAKGFEPKIEQWVMTLGDEFDELFDRLEAAEESGLYLT